MGHIQRIAHFVLVVAAFFGAEPAMAQIQQKIARSQLEAMFSDMRAKAPWNVDGPLLWGYFFLDTSRGKLELAASELAAQGYQIVGIEPVSGGRFRLHVERVEIHSPSSLDARNQQLYALAERLKIGSYDGMDVGPAVSPAKR